MFGSLAWQHLTGLPYLAAGSDLDLLWRVCRTRAGVDALLHGIARHRAGRADAPGWRGRSRRRRRRQLARAAARPADEVLVKWPNGVGLMARAAFLDALRMSASILHAAVARSTRQHERIAARATLCLHLEIDTYPKPGLVSAVDSGAHSDMDAALLHRSAAALQPFFADLAAAGAAASPMDRLRAIGLDAERAMLAATGGVNTHRGAIFGLGLLVAAAGFAQRYATTLRLGTIVANLWGPAILAAPAPLATNGAMAGRRYGVGGARGEACAGFASVYRIALPALASGMAVSGSAEAARVQACFALIAAVDDTNLLHRGGADGLRFRAGAGARFPAGWRRRAAWTGWRSARAVHAVVRGAPAQSRAARPTCWPWRCSCRTTERRAAPCRVRQLMLGLLCSGQGTQNADMFRLTADAPAAARGVRRRRATCWAADPRVVRARAAARRRCSPTAPRRSCASPRRSAAAAMIGERPASATLRRRPATASARWAPGAWRAWSPRQPPSKLAATRAELMDAGSGPEDGLAFVRGLNRAGHRRAGRHCTRPPSPSSTRTTASSSAAPAPGCDALTQDALAAGAKRRRAASGARRFPHAPHLAAAAAAFELPCGRPMSSVRPVR